VTILQAMHLPALFAGFFGEAGTWAAWEAFLAAFFADSMTEAQLALYRAHTGRQRAPETAAREAWVIVGRRGGKSLIAALVAVFCACFRDYTKHLAPGERATVAVIAADRPQARVVKKGGKTTLLLHMVRAILDGRPFLGRDTRQSRVVYLTEQPRARFQRGATEGGPVGPRR